MSKKILNETQIRRFQQLANLPALEEGMYGDRDEDESADPVGDDLGADPMDDAMDVPAPDMEAEADGEVVLSSEDAQRVADALPAMEKIAAAVGEGEDELDAEDELGDEVPVDDAEPAAVEMGAEDELMEALNNEGIEVLEEGDIVDAVIKRVATRLVNESRRQRKNKKLESLAEKIANRIASGK